MEYDYARYQEIVTALLEAAWRSDEPEIGEDISDIPSVKIIFDGHGDLEITNEDGDYIDTEEGGNKTMESYAIFIHQGSGAEDFVFPDHEQTPWALIHRPQEEVCIYAWYDAETESWDIAQLEDCIGDCRMDAAETMTVLETIWSRWFTAPEIN